MKNNSNTQLNTSSFAKLVLPVFVCAYTHNADLNSVCNTFLERTKDEKRILILRNCLNFFQTPEIREKINIIYNNFSQQTGQIPTDRQLSNILLEKFEEQITGLDKRKYDMSDLYSPKMISNVKPNDYRTPKKPFPLEDPSGNTILIEDVGFLSFSSGWDDYITKYKITTPNKVIYIYSNIDYSKLTPGSYYYDAFFAEFLSKNNISRSNTCNYIGELVDTQVEDKPLQIHQEISDGTYYKYQINKGCALVYDSIPASAVMKYTKERNVSQER